jgi:hypothetical protein
LIARRAASKVSIDDKYKTFSIVRLRRYSSATSAIHNIMEGVECLRDNPPKMKDVQVMNFRMFDREKVPDMPGMFLLGHCLKGTTS